MFERQLALLLAALKNLIGTLQNKNKMPTPPQSPVPNPAIPVVPVTNTPPKYLWNTPANARHSVRVICDEEGLSVDLKDVLCACVAQESTFNPVAVNENKNKDGVITSKDYGIVQVNDYWNIGPGKPFPSAAYVLANPEACVRWMCKMFLAGKMNLWASWTSGAYKKFL